MENRSGRGGSGPALSPPLPSSGAALSARIPGWSGAPRQARHGGRPLRLGAGKRPPGRSATSSSGGFPTALLLRLQPLDPPERKTLYVVSSQSGQRRFAGTLAGEERLQLLRVEGKGEPRGFLSPLPRRSTHRVRVSPLLSRGGRGRLGGWTRRAGVSSPSHVLRLTRLPAFVNFRLAAGSRSGLEIF